MTTYHVRTRNWNNNQRAAVCLQRLQRFGVQVWPHSDKYSLNTNSQYLAHRILAIFRRLQPLTGGMTRLDGPDIHLGDVFDAPGRPLVECNKRGEDREDQMPML